MSNFATRNHASHIACHVPVVFVEFDWYMGTWSSSTFLSFIEVQVRGRKIIQTNICASCTVQFLTFERKSQHNGRPPRNTYAYFFFLSCIRSRYFNINFVPVHRYPLPRNYKTFGFAKQVLSPVCVIYWHLITFAYRIFSNINRPCV